MKKIKTAEMTFLKAWNNFWTKRYDIADCAARSEFWLMFPFFFVLPYLFALFVIPAMPPSLFYFAWTADLIFLTVTFVPTMTLSIRRFNDASLPYWIPIILIGGSDGVNILTVFGILTDRHSEILTYVSGYTWLAYMFAFGACTARPSKK